MTTELIVGAGVALMYLALRATWRAYDGNRPPVRPSVSLRPFEYTYGEGPYVVNATSPEQGEAIVRCLREGEFRQKLRAYLRSLHQFDPMMGPCSRCGQTEAYARMHQTFCTPDEAAKVAQERLDNHTV